MPRLPTAVSLATHYSSTVPVWNGAAARSNIYSDFQDTKGLMAMKIKQARHLLACTPQAYLRQLTNATAEMHQSRGPEQLETGVMFFSVVQKPK